MATNYQDRQKIPFELSKRKKLSESDKKEIRKTYKTSNTSYNELARLWGVSKRTIIFAVNPEKYEIAKKQRRERWAEGRYRDLYDKETHRKAMADLRARKSLLPKQPKK